MGGHTARSPQNGVVEGEIRRVCVCFAVGCDGVAAVVRRSGEEERGGGYREK